MKSEEGKAAGGAAPEGVLLIAHGSRRTEANDDLVQLARQIAARLPETVVEAAYLELARPTVAEGARRCVDRGARLVRLLPYFLSLGRHVTHDLEELRRELSREYLGVQFALCRPLGLHPQIVDVVMERLHEPVQSL